MDGVDYLHMQLRLEGISVPGRRFLRQVQPVPGEDLPLMIVVQFADRQVGDYHDEALPPELQSNMIENTASAHLAKRLGLQPVFEEISISYPTV